MTTATTLGRATPSGHVGRSWSTASVAASISSKLHQCRMPRRVAASDGHGTPQVGPGLAARRLGTTTRADGHQQVTYSGHPLYYFAGDAQPGFAAGQGLNDNGELWFVLRTDGTPDSNALRSPAS
jgi:hypothetical protein